MGIDACLLLRLKGEKPTEDQLTEWSWNLGRAIGAKHFFIKDGIASPEYHAADRAWHEAFNAHPMYARWQELGDAERKRPFTASPSDEYKALGDAIRASCGARPEQRRRALELTNTLYPLTEDDYSGVPTDYRPPGRCYVQDGDTIYAEPGEWFLNVSLWTRYYGPGYERGDILTICAIAEWCELNLPSCTVWYGGDSSGCEAVPFTVEKRLELKRHLYSAQGRNYYAYSRGHPPLRPVPCSLCVAGGNFDQYGSGTNYCAVSCGGCGQSFETRDGGRTWTAPEKDFA